MSPDDSFRTDCEVDELVDQLLAAFQTLGDADLLMLRSRWEAGDSVARERAWRAARTAVSSAHRGKVFDDAKHRLATWVNNYDAAYGVFGGSAGGTEGVAPATVRQAAIPPLLDAVIGTIARDHISEDDYYALGDPLMSLRAMPDDAEESEATDG